LARRTRTSPPRSRAAFSRPSPGTRSASFEVDEFTVNGNPVAICTSKLVDRGRMLVTYHDDGLKALLGQSVIVEATFKVKVPKRAHSINLSVPVPTRDVVIAMHYGDTEIRRVEVIDLFVSGRRPGVRHLPTSNTTRQNGVEVHLRDWAFPRGGVVFTWQLWQEQGQVFEDLLAGHDES
jgi:hypothetical protein